MKNTLVIITLLAFLSPCLLGNSAQQETRGVKEAKVTAKKAKIYLEASPFSIVIDTIQQGTVVALFPSGKKDKKWLYISYYSIKRNAQVTGFIEADLVEIFAENRERQEEKDAEKTEEAEDKEDSPPVELSKAVKIDKEATEKDLSSEVVSQEETKTGTPETDKAEKAKNDETEKQMEEKIESFEKGKKEMAEEAGLDKKQEIHKEESKIIEESPVKESKQIQEEKSSTEGQQPPDKKTEQRNDGEKEVATPAKEQKMEEIGETSRKPLVKEEVQVSEKEQTVPEGEKEEPLVEKGDEEKAMEAEKEALSQVLTKVSIKVRMANIRLMPNLQSAVIHQLPFGVELKALAKTGNWYKVNLPQDESGIVLSGYIHHSIVNEIYESVQPPVEPEEPEEKPEIIEEEPEPIPEPEKKVEPPPRTEKSRLSLWIGGGAGYTLPSESRFDKGLSFGGIVGLKIMKFLALEIRVPYFQSNVSGSFEGLSSGQLQNLTFMLSLQARYPLNDRLVPYLVGGGDYHWNKFSLNNTVINSWNDLGFTIEENVDHSFGFHAGAGLDFFLSHNIALNVDVRYYTANLKGTWSLLDQISQQKVSGTIESMKLNSIQAGISVKFFLGR